MLGDDVDKESDASLGYDMSDSFDSECLEQGFIVDDDEFSDEELNQDVKERRERINVLELRKQKMFSFGESMRPEIQLQRDIGDEFTAVSL